jgi:hypothetical protein
MKLAAIMLFAGSLTIATLGAGSAQLTPDPNHCKGDGQPYRGVACNKNHDPGGPIGCFRSMCEAHAVGAYDCSHVDSCDYLTLSLPAGAK